MVTAIEKKLSLDDLEPLNDDGSARECACCAMSEGRTPKRFALPPLSLRVLDVAAPWFESIGVPASLSVWELGLRVAGEAWNLAVERRTNPAARRTLFVRFTPTGNDLDATPLLEVLADAKNDLYPDDVRIVETVRLRETGEFWCKPKAPVRVVPTRTAC